jgi:hypothetical protein
MIIRPFLLIIRPDWEKSGFNFFLNPFFVRFYEYRHSERSEESLVLSHHPFYENLVIVSIVLISSVLAL